MKTRFRRSAMPCATGLLLLLMMGASGCVVRTAVSVTKDVVVGTVDIATDVVGTAVDVVVPGKKKKN